MQAIHHATEHRTHISPALDLWAYNADPAAASTA